MAKPAKGFSDLLKRSLKKTGRTGGFGTLRPEVRHQFEKMTSGIVLEASSGGPRTILFTSYDHGEGTTTVVNNFAQSLAQERRYRTLVVDANTRSPALQQTGAIDGDMTFSEVLAGGIESIALPKPSNGTNLSVIPGGNVVYHPSQVFDHRRFSKFVKNAKKLFHFVLFDSSPTGSYYDSVVLGSHVDGVVLVVEAEKTQFHDLKWAKQLFKERGIPILGVVLNRRKFHIPRFVFERFFG